MEKENKLEQSEGSPEKYADIPFPQPYTFKLRKLSSGYITNAPPFYVQLDNAIAVIWALFGSNTPLDISHLHWALAFLSKVQNVQGEYPPDVHFCVQEIQNRLLEKYSEGVRKTNYEDNDNSAVRECDLKPSITFKELTKYQSSVLQELYCNQNAPSDSSNSSKIDCTCTSSKGTCVDSLKQLRKDQVVKIEMELLRLYELEQEIETTDRSCITPFIDDSVATRLKKLKVKIDSTPED